MMFTLKWNGQEYKIDPFNLESIGWALVAAGAITILFASPISVLLVLAGGVALYFSR